MSLFDLTANTNARKVPILNPDYPHDVTMNATDGVTAFHVALSNHGRPKEYTYQWYVNDVVVPGATQENYYRNVSEDKGILGVYCEVTNKAGTVRTRNARLTVNRIPNLNSNYPADVSVNSGKNATFSVSISSHGYPENYRYQWYVNGTAVNGATASSYVRDTSGDMGQYSVWCEVSNNAGVARTRQATLTVNKLPVLNGSFPEDTTILESNNAIFSASVSKHGYPTSYSYQWYVDGTAVVGATAAEYVRNVSSDKGVHAVWCEVSNKAGTVRTREATLTVYRLPVLHESYPANGSVYVGTTITVQALIAESGYPNSYTYQWYKDGSLVPGANGSSYSFYRTTEGTSTVFCVVKNDSGTVTTRTATITANRIYLYLSGDQCSAITGGWAAAISSTSSGSGANFYEDSIYLESKPNVRAASCGTAYPIDLSRQSRLTIQAYKGDSSDGYFYMAVSSTLNSFDTGLMAQQYITGGIDYYSMDISNVSAGHIILCAWAPNSVQTAGIYQVWLG